MNYKDQNKCLPRYRLGKYFLERIGKENEREKIKRKNFFRRLVRLGLKEEN